MVYMEQQPLLGNGPTEYDTLRRASIPQVPNLPREQSLSWTSSYILVVSRVIGSGIFATPGSIVRSTGSVGLAFVVWTVGTLLAACGLVVSLEYGCMLPRSGGEKVYIPRAKADC